MRAIFEVLCLPLIEMPWLYKKHKAVVDPVLLLHLSKKKKLGWGTIADLTVPHWRVPALLRIESQNVTMTKKNLLLSLLKREVMWDLGVPPGAQEAWGTPDGL